MSALALLLLGLLPPLVALRSEDTTLLSVTDVVVASSPDGHVVTIKPGKLGIRCNLNTGKIFEVEPASQAARLGLEPGGHIIRIGKRPVSEGAWNEAKLTRRAFEITIEPPNTFVLNVEMVLKSFLPVAGSLCCVFVVGLPFVFCAIACHKWEMDVFIRALSHPLPLSLFIVCVGSVSGLAALDWPYCGIVYRIYLLGDLAYYSALVAGVLMNRHNKALNVPLQNSAVELSRKIDLAVLAVCSVCVLCLTALNIWRDIYMPCMTSAGCRVIQVQKFVSSFGNRLDIFLLLVFTLYISRIAVATQQQMLEVQKGMPSEPVEFFDRVHKPLSVFLRNSTPQLVTCGWPLVLAAPETIIAGFRVYNSVMAVRISPYIDNWIILGFQLAHLPAVALAVVLGPLLLATALQDFRDKLEQERHRDPTMHIPIQTVEAMLKHHNSGRGFGIPVCSGFVLTKDLLQQICIRLALLATAIKTFLDAEMGFAKEPEQALGPQLADMRHAFNNITNVTLGPKLADMQHALSNISIMLDNLTQTH